MKILQVIPYIPAPPTFGGALRVYHLLKHNYKHHDLTVAGYVNEGTVEAMEKDFPGIKNKMHFIHHPKSGSNKRILQALSLFSKHSNWYRNTYSNEMQALLNKLTDQTDFDLIQVEFPPLCQFEFRSDAKRIMDAHNVEYDNFYRMYKLEKSLPRKYFYKREYEKFYTEEVELASRQDAVFTTSERDKSIFQGHLPDMPIHVIPNGVDTEFFAPSDQPTEPNTLVFTGMMGYVPNSDGMLYFIESVLPLIQKQIPDVKVYVVGKNPPQSILEKASDNIIVTGFVDDVRPYVHRSAVYIVPLRMGGGTRLKVLEALSMKKPVVTTSIGCEGIDVVHDTHAIITDDAQSFAESVIKLLHDKKESKRLSENGYELIHNHYEWNAIGEKMETAFQTLVDQDRNKTGNNIDPYTMNSNKIVQPTE
ncbi:glycosyltransferase family 4 protein [Gracilimonas amylolytica]|uniref:glycosyltransferase family 4 protein n=1 Tax=Gracilimonas amylolytica TaxID=1749045 RepID=UPI000CD9011C|nr:glycosyltransferase family 4 protein [Gracilimonas amylolytica]